MENQNFELVRQILKSPIFLAQSLQEKQNTFDQIIATGEISEQDIFQIIQEEMAQQEQSQIDQRLIRVLNSFDYNAFLNFIVKRDLKGKDLISLCNTSKKFNEYCNRSFQLQNNQGQLIGEAQDQYLFRLLLSKMNIKVPNWRTPRQAYIDRTIGSNVLAFGQNNNGRLGLGHMIIETLKLTPSVNPYIRNIVQVSSGMDHTLCLDNQGRVWGFGFSNYGQLGLGRVQIETVPTLIAGLNNIIQVAAGVEYSLCLDKGGRVWSFGSGEHSKLGSAIIGNRLTPAMIPNFGNIIQISAGDHALCLDNQGRVWTFGSNTFGQLGLGQGQQVTIPTLIRKLDNIVQVCAGNGQSYCLDNQGRVWSFGVNTYGELGLGDNNHRYVPTIIPYLTNIVQVSGNYLHCLCLDDEGNVWAFGNNKTGQLGISEYKGLSTNKPNLIPNISNIVQVSTGEAHSLCLDCDGKVWVFGQNTYGQLGLGNTKTKQEPTIIPNLNNIVQVIAGRFSSFCLQGL